MTNYRFNLKYNASNELVSSTFTETSSPTPSVTLNRDADHNTHLTVYALNYADAVSAANKALGEPKIITPTHTPSSPPISFMEAQVKARRICKEILCDSALLGDDAIVKIPVGLLRFLVDSLDIAGQEMKDA